MAHTGPWLTLHQAPAVTPCASWQEAQRAEREARQALMHLLILACFVIMSIRAAHSSTWYSHSTSPHLSHPLSISSPSPLHLLSISSPSPLHLLSISSPSPPSPLHSSTVCLNRSLPQPLLASTTACFNNHSLPQPLFTWAGVLIPARMSTHPCSYARPARNASIIWYHIMRYGRARQQI